MKTIIDRIEEDFAVLEMGEKTFNIPRALVPDAKEGDTVDITVTRRQPAGDGESPHEIFERLRRKSRAGKPEQKRRKKGEKRCAETDESADDAAVSYDGND